MGITIHYSGSIRHSSSLPDLIEEVKDIASIYKWKYQIYETSFPENAWGKEAYEQKIYGISFTPPESEPVYFCFLSNGKMSNEHLLEFYGNSKKTPEAEYLYMPFTKTQFAGKEIHKQVIQLLKYISKKYLQNFKVLDEGNYWETEDEKLLEETFNKYSEFITDFSNAIKDFQKKEGESYESYFERLINQFRGKDKE